MGGFDSVFCGLHRRIGALFRRLVGHSLDTGKALFLHRSALHCAQFTSRIFDLETE